MSDSNLSQRLSRTIVDALNARGHIAITRSGAVALARELEDEMADDIATVAPRLDPWALADGEVTSTFVDETPDEQVEELVAGLTRALVGSDHVEDVLAEEHVLRREVLRALRDAVVGRPRDLGLDEGPARVRLDTLGYVASMVGRHAPAVVVRDALSRAAQSVGCRLTAYDFDAREAMFTLSEATFSITVSDPDSRLDLEQAVADELAELVSANVVRLPAVVRRVELARPLDSATLGRIQAAIDGAAARLLRQGGSAAAWAIEGNKTLRVAFTPASERDALDIDRRAAELAREIDELAGATGAVPAAAVSAARTPAKKAAKKAAAKKPAAKKAAAKKPAAKKAAAKKPAAKKAAAKKPGAKKKAPAKRAGAKKASAKRPAAKKARAKKAPAKRAAAKRPAAKKATKKRAAGKRTAAKRR